MKIFEKGLVSIIMPAYNASMFISQAIQSVINQSYTNWELIIVEDCSTDNTKEILKKLNHPNIIIFYNTVNKGPGYNCRKAINCSKGEFITRLDSDDIFTDGRLLEQITFFNNNPRHVFVSGNAQYINNNGDYIGFRNSVYNSEKLKWKILFKNPIISSTVMFRNEIAHKNHIEFSNNYLSEDYEFWSNLLQFGKGEIVPNIWLKYRINPDGLTFKNVIEMNKNAIMVSYELIVKLVFIDKNQHDNLLKWYNNENKLKDDNYDIYKLVLKKYSSKLGFFRKHEFYISQIIFRNFYQKILYKLIQIIKKANFR